MLTIIVKRNRKLDWIKKTKDKQRINLEEDLDEVVDKKNENERTNKQELPRQREQCYKRRADNDQVK